MSIRKSLATTGLALLMATTIPVVNGSPIEHLLHLVARDPPQALPEKATANDKKWQPAMDFDTDGCYNTPAIDANGNINPGLDHDNTGLSEDCHDPSDLANNNVYSRARCNNGWCAYLYDYYFEKDVALANFPFDPGHRNDWEHVVVFVQNDEAKVVAVSQHGGYQVKSASDVRWDGTHPKVVYNKDGISTHDFRFANEGDDKIENDTGKWFYGALISYNGFPSTALRDKLVAYDFGSANIAFKDSSFSGQLEKARGDLVPGFDSNVDDGSPGNP
ncbi:NPP1-domain-containing protein [Daldinia decipiens]|uniref:NPP1-domain-containing protein n=1 Tax=Daldinia decipiens TaxID=326647 RepID=UPI0020C4EDB5|nr:NPP1-domain-containing protein [Daldinia decipiens]KAI1655053.1 NPP1-domain-containing protein [Daldinia decipiens]